MSNLQDSSDFILRSIYSGKVEGQHYSVLAFPYCSGGDLYSLIKQSMSAEVRRACATDVVAGLTYLHSHGVIYRE